MRIAIIGCGRFGQEILSTLVQSGKHEIYAIEENAKIVDELNSSQDIMALHGSGTDFELLQEIEMNKIDVCIACTGSDEINTLTCVYAKAMGAKHVISRILGEDQNSAAAMFMRNKLQIDLLVNPLYQTAKAIYDIIRQSIKKGDIIIIGANKISYYLTKMLLKHENYYIKIIDNDYARIDRICAALPEEVLSINGDSADHNVLISEGLLEAKAFISLTNLDEENILTSLFALEHDLPCIVTKINKSSYTDIVRNLNLDNVVSPIGATAEIIIDFIKELGKK